jgi:hypothetical protein
VPALEEMYIYCKVGLDNRCRFRAFERIDEMVHGRIQWAPQIFNIVWHVIPWDRPRKDGDFRSRVWRCRDAMKLEAINLDCHIRVVKANSQTIFPVDAENKVVSIEAGPGMSAFSLGGGGNNVASVGNNAMVSRDGAVDDSDAIDREHHVHDMRLLKEKTQGEIARGIVTMPEDTSWPTTSPHRHHPTTWR